MKNLHLSIPLNSKINKSLVLIAFVLFKSILVNAQIKADFNSDIKAGCAPLVVQFKDSSSGNPTSWLWDLGNNTTSTFQNPSVAYFDPGTYTVTLVIKNTLGTDSITKVQYITVYSSPTINFSGSPLSGCFPLTPQFTDLSFPGSGTISNWQWDFGDGNLSGLKNPTHTYTSVGDFNVSLKISNNFGCVTSKTTTAYVHIHSGVKAGFTNSNPNSCNAPAAIDFTNQSTGTDSLTYQWDFGDGQTSVLANPSHAYTISGTFSVKLIVTNATGCTDTIIKANLITIGGAKANFTAPATVCQGTSFNLNNTAGSTPGSVSWDFGDGTFSNSTNPAKVYTTPGNYTIKMVADFGACKDSTSKLIQVNANPEVNFSAPVTASCQAPFTVNFTNSSSGGASYLWNFGDGSISTIQNASHTYLSEGSYTVKLIVTNASGCKDSLVKNNFIQIKSPTVSLNNLPQKGCAPLEHTFTANVNSVDAITNYQWNFGDGNISNSISPTYIYNSPGSYTVTLIYTTAGGCTDSVKAINGILVGSKPNSGFSADPRDACAYKSIQFTDSSAGKPDQWLWYFGDGGSSEIQNPKHQYNDTGYFSVTLIAINNGCPDTITFPKEIHINPPVARFIYSKTCTIPLQIIFKDQSIGADTWYWDFGDGTASTEKNPTHNYSSAGVYQVALTVSNQKTGCSMTKTQTVQVIREIANFTSSDSVICRNATVKFNALNNIPSNVNSYTWRFGDGASLSNSNNSVNHQYIKASAYNVTLIVKDINGCFDSITKPLSIQVDGPTSVFRSTTPGTCLNNDVSFFDSSYSDGVHPVTQWEWNWGDGNSQTYTTPPFSHSYVNAGNYSVSLKVTDSKGCTDISSKTNAIIVSKPVAIFSGDTLSCTTHPVNFYNSSTGPGLVYLWDFGDGTTSDKKNPVHTYNTEGTYSITLTIKDIYGCSSFSSKPGYVRIANPIANFNLSDSIGTCPPLVVNFTNTSANYSKWSWDFGDGTTSSERNPSHFYSAVGTFKAVLTITGPGGCTSQKIKQIRVDGPSGSFSYTNLTGCDPVQTNFKAHTGKNISFIWDFNDGTTIPTSDSIITHTFTTPGQYLPKMILVNASGCNVPVTGKDTIKVFGVVASFKHTGALICDSGNVQFTNSSVHNDAIINYLWNFGDGSTSVKENPLHGYNHPGIYHTTLSVTTQRGCKDSVYNINPITVNTSPKASVSGKTGACVPAVLNFSGIISQPDTSSVSWKWDFANGNTSTQKNPVSQNYPKDGFYNVKAIAFSSNGCNDTIIKPIEIYPLPGLIKSSNAVVCFGTTAPLQVSGAKNYSWSPSTYLSCTNCANPVSKPDSAIKYQVKGTSDKGCISKDSVSLIVKYPFKISVSKEDTLCLGKSVQLNAGGTEVYQWSPSAGLNNPLIASPEAAPPTTITYRVIGSDSAGCFKDTGYIPVKVFPVPVVSAGSDKTINVGQQFDIAPQISKDVTDVTWTPSTGIVSNHYPGITVMPRESIEYTIDVKNAGGCRARDKISIYVLCNNANVFVPNTFSPNGDGANDIFYPRGSGVFKIKNFRVFNRWGEVVFEKSNFNANDASYGWDGTYKGRKLSADVFVYTLEVVCDNNTSLVFKGNIALIN
ncbi:MAG: PKD domain-containing protein [Bacteroidota bacterium]|nr:PKD domain-containing protein [Bacteroidota bacterium]